ncbi:hypothetical protein [Roseateles koreensis]|uniref:Uncharacterized protein n=1 Tax=Roseateles koreensis TaxID=2987526 RepID=A0ABT5KQN5_9BURK|nr:hypothetical protein [Roseateles koreensis]MDC8785214.1 hypothetical protein [Roseateles koreensis]
MHPAKNEQTLRWSTASLALVLLPALLACTSPVKVEGSGDKASADERVSDAVTAPLQDLNLMQSKIPDVLQAAQEAPYKLPPDASCAGLAHESAALEKALGPDLDSPQRKEQQDAWAKSGEMAGDAAFGALRSASENLLPFRGWLRKLSGAERHSSAVTAALVAGQSRRAFLRGLQLGKSCH